MDEMCLRLGMTEEKPSSMTMIHEAHDTMLQHVEKGSRKIRTLAITTIAVTMLLGVTYLSQLFLPFEGVTSVTVNLGDPFLMVVELVEFVLVLAWLYVGISDYRFTTKLCAQIREVRAAEADLMKKHGLES
jgi:hypothetical protein